ncbi:MAG: glycosyltransferase family 4 protein [Phenylobacterium sp.]|uniref:glycosyltransferase family 4 protein n=1 Tax=Phenylobacterium sp. TaxID=1871053 RepID=UPI00391AE369
MRLAVVTSHPIQYYAPLFRTLAERLDLHVFFAHRATPEQQAAAGFGTAFDWDVDLASGYAHSFLRNVAADPGPHHFAGCDTPEVGARLAEGRFDAVLLLGWHLKSLLQALLAAKRQGLPAMVRGDSQLQTPRSPLKRLVKEAAYPVFLRRFDAALYVGARSRAYYEHYRYPAERLFFSPHCVDNAFFAERATPQARADLRARLGVAPQTPLVLFAGKLIDVKRPLDVVEAVARLRAQGVPAEVMVAGSGALEGPMRERAARLATPLHLLGFQNQSAMPAVYGASDVLVLPSASETWGLVCNEALACGRPIVVSSGVGCAEDLAGEGPAGRVYPVGEVPALADALGATFAGPPAAAAAVERAARYSLAAAADGVLAAVRAVGRSRP